MNRKWNPVFAMFLGLCPALAVTTRVINAWAIGAVVLVTLIATSLVVSFLARRVPPSISPYWELVIIAVFVTLLEILLHSAAPALTAALGIYLPLSAVNCIILNQAKGSAARKGPGEAVLDSLVLGAGFFLSLSLIALIREVLGAGTITMVPIGSFGGVIRIVAIAQAPARVLLLSSGGFLVVGYVMALSNILEGRKRNVSPARAVSAAPQERRSK